MALGAGISVDLPDRIEANRRVGILGSEILPEILLVRPPLVLRRQCRHLEVPAVVTPLERYRSLGPEAVNKDLMESMGVPRNGAKTSLS